MAKITFNEEDVKVLVLGAVEYGVFRKTYVSEQTISLVVRHWAQFEDDLKERIIYFVSSAQKRSPSKEWYEFLMWAKTNYHEKENVYKEKMKF